MKRIFCAVTIAMTTSPAWAGTATAVPEMDAGAGIAAIALLAGVAAIIREKMKK